MADRQVQSEILDKSGGLTPTDVKAASPGNQPGSRPGSTPSSSGRSPQKDYYWFAQAAELPSPPSDQKSTSNGDSNDPDGKESVSGLSQKDREERIRVLRERQSEERQRKLDDLKLAALHAQKVREQQEEDRRRKIEELKIRDQERRAMVEERKKQIWEAEKERREAILRKNSERDARIEARRNANRSSIGFAFGSSTPRLLDENGYFNNRRSASQTNVMLISTNGNRQSAERETDSNKRRASSSFRLDHKAGDAGEDLMTKSLSALMGPPIRGRRKTDLTPTLPLHDSPRTHSPGRALSMTRLDLLAQPRRPIIQSREHLRQKKIVNTTTNPLSRNKTKSMLHLASPRIHQQDLEKPTLYSSRSASKSMSHLSGAGVRVSQSSKVENNQQYKLHAQSMWHLTPAIVPRLTRAAQLRTTALLNAKRQGVSKSMMQLSKKRNDDESSENSFTAARTTPSSPSRPNSSMSQQSLSSHASQCSTVSMRNRNASHRPRPVSIAGTPTEKSPSAEERQGRSIERKTLSAHKTPPRAKSAGADQVTGDANLSVVKPPSGVQKRSSTKPVSAKTTPPPIIHKEKPKIPPKPISKTPPKQNMVKSSSAELPEDSPRSTDSEEILEASNDSGAGIVLTNVETELANKRNSITIENSLNNPAVTLPTDMEENILPAKPRITTEEEAKAALAERRRLAREQFEREAELERLRQEELKRQEEERIRQEEEERRRWEEEQDKLRQIEAERLKKAIEEQKLKEEEEQKQKEEENRLKLEKEEAERKSREEQEKLRRETEERLRKEEEERAERRKRVEAIMSRTRGRGTNNTPVTTPTKGTDGIIGKFDEAKTGTQPEKIQSEKLPAAEDSNIDGVLEKEMKPEVIEQNIPKDQNSSIIESIPLQPNQEDKEENTNKLIQSFSENKNTDLVQFHSNGFSENEETKETTNEFVVDNKSSEKKVSGNNLIDSFGEFEALKVKTPSETTQESVEFDQYIDLSVSNNSSLNTEDFINNADNVNSNIPTNGPGAPLIAFEDNFTKKQETNVTDLL